MENIILACLALSPMTGYSLRKFISSSVTVFSEVSFGTLYPALARLEKKGHISVISGEGKKVYQLTDSGRNRLDNWLVAEDSKFKMNYEFLTKLFFFALLEPRVARQEIENHIEQLQREQAELLAVKEGLSEDVDSFQFATAQFGVDFYDFLVTWHRENLPVLVSH